MNFTDQYLSGLDQIQYIDVEHRDDLPRPPAGMRYLDFIGGSLNLRCFLVPEALPRARFMEEHSDALDPCLQPIYAADGIRIRQDASYALPGFYILSFEQQYRSFDLIDPALFFKAMVLCHRVRALMREHLSIEYIHLHYEEKPDASCNVHFWIMPVGMIQGEQPKIIFELDIRQYLGNFHFRDHKRRILECNDIMRSALGRGAEVA